MSFILIKWKNIEDKVLNDSSKYDPVHYNVEVPSLLDLDEDLEYFDLVVSPLPPELDERLAEVGIINDMTNEVGALNQRIWNIGHVITPRTIADIEQSIDDIELTMSNSILADAQRDKRIFMYAAFERRQRLGLTMTQVMLDYLDDGDAIALRIYKNATTAIAKKAAVNAGLPADLDEGWEKAE